MTITLRYFEMSGGAQPLRDVLACAGVPFEDLRLSMADSLSSAVGRISHVLDNLNRSKSVW